MVQHANDLTAEDPSVGLPEPWKFVKRHNG